LFKNKLRKNKSIGVIPCYLFFCLVIFLNFFLNVSVSYSIKCKDEKKKQKKTGLNGTEAGASIFLCNG
jgi:hypothetical protein